MKIFAILLTLISAAASPAFAQEVRPECTYQSSDIDGDGFGFENSLTCVVTENSSPDNAVTMHECIDDNADGWGWNGVGSCEVEIPQSNCVDTDPIGDGWGWNGVTSCRVTPANNAFNELDEIETHLGTHPELAAISHISNAAAIYCPAARFFPEVTYYLLYNGSLRTAAGAFGMWGTGISTLDGQIKVSTGFSSSGFPLFIDGDRIIRGNRNSEGFCEWLAPQ